MIRITKSPTADTRTCDWSKVTKEDLELATDYHIEDVHNVLRYLGTQLELVGVNHDQDKLENLDQFYADFQTGFANTTWWDKHRKISRHHLASEDGVPENVSLLDVLEYIADCVCAGMARSGSVYELKMDPDVLMRAFKNTVEFVKKNVEVVE